MIGYTDEAGLQAYDAARGITLVRPEAVTLQLALDYLDSRTWKGEKTDEDQPLDFPRDGDTVVPPEIVRAQLVLAVIYDRGEDPLGAVGPRVTQETVVGAVSVSYSDKGNQTTYYPHLAALLRPFLGGLGGSQFTVQRG